jgi:small subunit ribosomal protein S4
MARFRGPKTKIARRFGEPIIGNPKYFNKTSNPPGQHGAAKKRKQVSEYGVQLNEKQKAKLTYGLLERQFRKTFVEAVRLKGVTGENLIMLLEARLDNTVYRLGIAETRPAARQLVSHKHITVNGHVCNIPSTSLKPGDVIGIKEKTAANQALSSRVRGKDPKISWLDWNDKSRTGIYVMNAPRENVPENIKEQLIVELYSK